MAEKPLEISAPRQGISPSPHQGFGDCRNIDIFSVPGVAKLNNILANVSGSAVTARVNWIVRDPVTVTNFCAVDTGGKVYVSTDSGATFAALGTQPTAGGAGQGLAIWKDYLWCPRSTAMDLYGPLSSSPAWRNSWAGLTMTSDSLWHPLLVSELDDKLYGGAGRDVFTVAEIVGQTFLWSNTATYTATAAALSGRLPANVRVKCLAELGNNLMIGTWKGTTITDFKSASIYPWDGSSSSYNDPIQMVENGVNAMLNKGSNLYVLAGIEGKIYKCNGVQAWLIGQIPLSVADISGGKYLEPYPGAIINFKDRVTFGISSASTSGMGIYSLQETSSGNILTMEHFVDSESVGGTNPLEIGALLGITRDALLVGYRDNTTYRIAKTTPTSYAYATDYSGYFPSPLYQVGSYLNKRKYNSMDLYLAKELASGEGIRIKFRINLTDSFTTLGTYTTTNIGTGVTSFHDEKINIPEAEHLQVQVELKGTSTTTPEFLRAIFS